MSQIISLFRLTGNTEKRGESLGERGERLAARFLERNGYRLAAANFRLPIGRNTRGALVNAEIDLVAYDGETLCFIEVKTRSHTAVAAPESAVDLRKRRQITRAARVYRKLFGLTNADYRFDVISIVWSENEAKIELFKSFWREQKFQKRYWADQD